MITLIDTRKAVEFFEAKLEFTTGPVELNSMIERGEYVDIIDVRSKEDFEQRPYPRVDKPSQGKLELISWIKQRQDQRRLLLLAAMSSGGEGLQTTLRKTAIL